MSTSDDTTKCGAMVHRHRTTTIQRIALHDEGQCSYKGKVPLQCSETGKRVTFCKTHARLALEGFVDMDGRMPPPQSMADYRRHFDKFSPPHKGVWTTPTACAWYLVGPDEPPCDQFACGSVRVRSTGQVLASCEHHLWVARTLGHGFEVVEEG